MARPSTRRRIARKGAPDQATTTRRHGEITPQGGPIGPASFPPTNLRSESTLRDFDRRPLQRSQYVRGCFGEEQPNHGAYQRDDTNDEHRIGKTEPVC